MVPGIEAGNLERCPFRPECQDILVERGNFWIRPDSQDIEPIIPFFLIVPLTIAGSATTSSSPPRVRTLAEKNGCPVAGFVSSGECCKVPPKKISRVGGAVFLPFWRNNPLGNS